MTHRRPMLLSLCLLLSAALPVGAAEPKSAAPPAMDAEQQKMMEAWQ